MKKIIKRIGFVPVFLAVSLSAQARAGWNVLKSVSIPPAKRTPGGKCQIAVPADWNVKTTVVDRGEASAPGGMGTATIWEYPPTPVTFEARKHSTLSDYNHQKAALLKTYHQDVLDIKVLDDSPTRLSVLETNTEPLSTGGKTWTVFSAGNPVCYAQVFVGGTSPTAPPADRAAAQKLLPIAQKIIDSFGPAK